MFANLTQLRPVVGALLLSAAVAVPAHSSTWQASVATGGELALCAGGPNQFCFSIQSAISDDGRYVSFSSVAENLVPGPHNSSRQIYVHDRLNCVTTRITENENGLPGNGNSGDPDFSGDGRFLAFDSTATNLIPGGTNGNRHIFVHDLERGETVLASVSDTGEQANANSAAHTISHDGRYVVFQSSANNLVPNDANNNVDIFVRDLVKETTIRVSVNEAGEQGNGNSRRPSMSNDGRFIVFDSTSTNFVDGSTNTPSVYLHDRDANETGIFDEPGGFSVTKVSVNNDGESANAACWWPVVSDDGKIVAFGSTASNLADGITNGAMDIFTHNLETGETVRESIGPNGEEGFGGSWGQQLTPDGQYLVFHSANPNFIDGPTNNNTHIFRRDRLTGENIIVSVNADGELSDGSSESGAMTSNGQTIAFASTGTNLVPDHENVWWVDVFVHSLRPADINHDGTVDGSDLLMLLGGWGTSCGMTDLNADGIVDGADLLILLSDWGN